MVQMYDLRGEGKKIPRASSSPSTKTSPIEMTHFYQITPFIKAVEFDGDIDVDDIEMLGFKVRDNF